MSVILYGKPAAENLIKDLSERASAFAGRTGRAPKIAVLRVGERQDDIAYESHVLKLCDDVGIDHEVTVFASDVTHDVFKARLMSLNGSEYVHGILVFRPLPAQIYEAEIAGLILPEKDIDCMNPVNLHKVFINDRTAIAPCTPEAVVELLKYYGYGLQGKNAVIINRSLVIGKPLAMLLLAENATVTICHSKTENLPEITKNADIVVSGTGTAGFLDETYVSAKNTIIDVGINFADGKMCGDADFEAVSDKVQAITPVPGGLGTVTSVILLKHLIEAAEHSA